MVHDFAVAVTLGASRMRVEMHRAKSLPLRRIVELISRVFLGRVGEARSLLVLQMLRAIARFASDERAASVLPTWSRESARHGSCALDRAVRTVNA